MADGGDSTPRSHGRHGEPADGPARRQAAHGGTASPGTSGGHDGSTRGSRPGSRTRAHRPRWLAQIPEAHATACDRHVRGSPGTRRAPERPLGVGGGWLDPRRPPARSRTPPWVARDGRHQQRRL